MIAIRQDINVHLRAIIDAEIAADWPAYERAVEGALEIDPKNPAALYSRALYRLRFGLPGGWEDFEYRKPRLELCEDLDEWPEWQGESLESKHILIAGEQGLGDQIMFSRYVPLVQKLGPRRVTLHVRAELARLFAAMFPGVEIVTDDRYIDCDDLDCWMAMGSLPLRFGFARPMEMPSFEPPARLAETNCFKVGLCWAGSEKHGRDKYRSMSFPDLAPVLDLTGCEFYAFQFGPQSAQNDGRAMDLTHFCQDLADTFSMLVQMDFIVTVDTAMAHLAAHTDLALLIRPTGYLDWRWSCPAEWYCRSTAIRLCSAVPHSPYSAIEQAALLIKAAVERREHTRGCGWKKTAAVPEPPLISTAETRYGPMQYFTRDKWLGRSLREYGEWSEGEVELFRAFIKSGDVVVEAGANIGAHTRAFIDIVGPSGRVLAFEPVPQIRDLLISNCALWPSADIHECALGTYPNKIPMTFDPCNPGGSEFDLNADRFGAGVEIERLDDVISSEHVFFLKADVEGMELDVLRGAEQTIQRCRPILYLENDRPHNSEALLTWLHDHQYRIYFHSPRLFNPDNWKGNPVNVFGNIVSAMVLGIPREKFIAFSLAELGLIRVRAKKSG